jgi:putative ABC transport system permease protein
VGRDNFRGFMHRQLKYAVRQIGRQPVASLAILVTLGLGIGATTAIFSFANALLLRPFPFRDAGQLVEIHSLRGGEQGKLSMREVLDIREQVTLLDGVAAYMAGNLGYNYSGDSKPVEWRTILTTGNLFEVLGIPLRIGTVWPATVDRERDDRVVISYGAWQTSFGGQNSVIGKAVTLDHAPDYRIDGVAPAGFDFPSGVEVYRSIGGFADYEKRGNRNVVAVARIRGASDIAQLQQQLDVMALHLQADYPETNTGLTFRAVSFRELYSGNFRSYLAMLLAAAGFVLLMACINVANVQLARALARNQEMRIRIAIGAGSSELRAMLLTESLILALAAGGSGIVFAYWWMHALRTVIGVELPAWMVINLDFRVLLFTLVLSISTGIVSGIGPALFISRGSLAANLKESSRTGSASRATMRFRDVLIVGQIAAATILLIGAGLLIRAFTELESRDKGFRSESISTFRVALGWKRYTTRDQINRYYERALIGLSQTPGIESVAFITNPPLARQQQNAPTTVQTEEQSVPEALQNPFVVQQAISENYFDVMGIPLMAGRTFTRFDGADSQPVVIVSQRLATRLWPGQNPIGRRVRYNPTRNTPLPLRTVVGVVSDVVQERLGGPGGYALYVPYRQSADANQYILCRTRLSETQFRAKIEAVLWAIDSEQSMFDFKTYDQRILESVWQLRIARLLFLIFGAVALILAAIGIYGVMSYMVGQRAREIGIRLALGARPGEIQHFIVARGLVLTAAGLAGGMSAAWLMTRGLAAIIEGVNSRDPKVFAVPLVILFAVAVSASYLPAWRASRIDPAITLRQE